MADIVRLQRDGERSSEYASLCLFVRGISEPLHLFVCLFYLFIYLILRKCILNTLLGGA